MTRTDTRKLNESHVSDTRKGVTAHERKGDHLGEKETLNNLSCFYVRAEPHMTRAVPHMTRAVPHHMSKLPN